MIKYLLIAALVFAPAAAFANSTVNATAGTGATISPGGTVVVPTGTTQTFTFGARKGYEISNVTFNGGSLGAVTSYRFTEDGNDHTLRVSASRIGAATQPWCSSPTAPGWNVNYADGGCGGSNIYVAYGSTTLLKSGLETTCTFRFGCTIAKHLLP